MGIQNKTFRVIAQNNAYITAEPLAAKIANTSLSYMRTIKGQASLL